MKIANDDVSVEAALAHYFECLDRGEAPDEASLVAQFPQHALELKQFFADDRRLSAQVHELSSASTRSNRLTIRCPICQQPNAVAIDSTWIDLECGSCNSP